MTKSKRGKHDFYICKYCNNTFTARVADRNRGWATFCSKACSASYKNMLKFGTKMKDFERRKKVNEPLLPTARTEKSTEDKLHELLRGRNNDKD